MISESNNINNNQEPRTKTLAGMCSQLIVIAENNSLSLSKDSTYWNRN